MRIHEIRLQSGNLAALRDFYAQALGLPIVADCHDELSLRAGRSRLTFVQARAEWRGRYHFAFNIPRDELAVAKRWIAARAPLASDSAGNDQFLSENWRAEQVYFYDPAGNIVEFIARQTLSERAPGSFDWSHLLNISEIGVATDDVPALTLWLRESLGVTHYRDPGDNTFAAIGDEQGLFIVVQRGRIWFPETGIAAEAMPIEVTVDGVFGGRYTLIGPPYRIRQCNCRADADDAEVAEPDVALFD